MSRPLRVCLHAPLLWPLWSDGRIPFTGGAEVQQARIARALVQRGCDVTVVTCDYGQPAEVVVHGVRVRRTYRLEAGLPVLRFFHPRLSRTIAALAAADADVYYVRGASLEVGTTFEVARARRAGFVFAAAHDLDADASLPLLRSPRDRAWYVRGLRGADAVVSQTEAQQQGFRAGFARESVVVRNLVEAPATAGDPGANGPIVWLATYKSAKRPEWFVQLARALPQHHFIMCGVVPIPPETTAAWEAAQRAARELPNLEVRGFLDPSQVATLLHGAALFVHTSPAEGFPNTLLEAWSYGIPSLSCVDPDGVVVRLGLGEVVADTAALIAATERWMAAPDQRRAAGARARAHVIAEHGPDAVLDRLLVVLSAAGAAHRARTTLA